MGCSEKTLRRGGGFDGRGKTRVKRETRVTNVHCDTNVYYGNIATLRSSYGGINTSFTELVSVVYVSVWFTFHQCGLYDRGLLQQRLTSLPLGEAPQHRDRHERRPHGARRRALARQDQREGPVPVTARRLPLVKRPVCSQGRMGAPDRVVDSS